MNKRLLGNVLIFLLIVLFAILSHEITKDRDI